MNRHRFEPARLLLGLALLGAALMYLMDTLGEWPVATGLLLLLVPAALLLGAVTALTAYAVRRARGGHDRGGHDRARQEGAGDPADSTDGGPAGG